MTTDWAVPEALAGRCPAARVEPDAILNFDGPLRTAAGVTAGLDLALALMEENWGELARQAAAQFVMFFGHGGGQMQLSRHGLGAPVGRSALQEVQRWVAAHPAEDHGVERLPARTGMSPRHFVRLFQVETGLMLATYVEGVRIEATRRLLESRGMATKQVAGACGFRDAGTLWRAFARRAGTTPVEYRRCQGGTGLCPWGG
ncbi:GlxA family transcriptional regulator [Pararoseomonas indoligenes]|uniref:Helix-turn-helix domain-containing protein n=1 Tax=Roseomonas indoligenes TaxID=2820811 RepID=A0A940N1K4_9PROT|nr:helix-turn-helix domain-containing protein [Pararoseomonas indoligenes]